MRVNVTLLFQLFFTKKIKFFCHFSWAMKKKQQMQEFSAYNFGGLNFRPKVSYKQKIPSFRCRVFAVKTWFIIANIIQCLKLPRLTEGRNNDESLSFYSHARNINKRKAIGMRRFYLVVSFPYSSTSFFSKTFLWSLKTWWSSLLP